MEKFMSVLQVIKNAWEELNPNLLREVLAEDIVYHEDPNEQPLGSVDAVVERWKKDLQTHFNVVLNYEIIDIGDDNCIAKWDAEWEDQKKGQRTLKGVYYLDLDQHGKLHEFRQWWL